MKKRVAKSTPLTHFARHATAEQKQAVHDRVIKNAIARQKRVLSMLRNSADDDRCTSLEMNTIVTRNTAGSFCYAPDSPATLHASFYA